MRHLARVSFVVPLLLALRAAPVAAFSEDLCWPTDASGLVSCTPLPQACEPAGSVSGTCLTAAVAVYATVPGYAHARSALHADVSYLLAQAVGFAAEDAYWIAAYDQAVDLGRYEPVDRTGAAVGGGQLATAVIDGFERNNLADGGVYYHFIAPRAPRTGPPQPVDGLHPDVSDAQIEGFLAHLRAWAMEGAGTGRPICTDGLSSDTGLDYALGPSCFQRVGGQPAQIDGTISVFATQSVSFQSFTGTQVVVSDQQPGGPVHGSDFDNVVGGDPARSANARLGIYLHALADRISHHVCTDSSVLAGPRGLAQGFDVDMSHAECTQGTHALRHIWEIGVDPALLAPEHRTLEAALEAIYDELLAFAAARGVLRPEASDPAFRSRWLSALAADLRNPNAAGRLDALALRACAEGWPEFPGSQACYFGSGFE